MRPPAICPAGTSTAGKTISRRPWELRSISKRVLIACAAVSLAGTGSGCSTVHYLYQAGKGQFAISNRARPIDEITADEKTPPRLKGLLGQIPSIKKFGEERGLKPTKNYTEFVQLDRPAASWVVSACEPLEFKSREWHFPIVGSFPYLGWFDLDDAKGFVKTLKADGLDVDLRGARAFSTLGWFRDPVLSSMIPEGEEALGEVVDVVIHESVHATLYVNGQAYFDESLASFVAERMTPDYLAGIRGADSAEQRAWLKHQREFEEKEKFLHQAYLDLKNLYGSGKPDSEKLSEKALVLAKLKAALKSQRDFNNASLIQYKTYGEGRREFEALLRACGSDWRRFMQSLSRIKPESFGKPQQEDLAPVIMPLVAGGCQ